MSDNPNIPKAPPVRGEQPGPEVWRLLAESGPDWSGWLDAEGGLRWVNPAVEKMTGLGPADCLALEPDLSALIHPKDRDRFSTLLQAALNTPRRDLDLNFRIINTQGETRYLTFAWQPLIGPDGADLGLKFSARDATNRRLSESALIRSEQLHRRLYNQAPVMLHSADARGRLTYVSQTWLERLGYERTAVLGRRLFDFFSTDSRKEIRDTHLPGFMASGECTDLPLRMIRGDGSIMDVEASARAEVDGEGNLLSSMAAIVDVTDRKRAREQLQRSREHFRRVFEHSPVPLWEMDLSRVKEWMETLQDSGVTELNGRLTDLAERVNIRDLNRATREMFGVDDKNEIIADFTSLVGEDGWRTFAEINTALLKGRTEGALDVRLLGPDGEPAYYLFKWAMMNPDRDDWSRFLLSMTNITDQKKAEMAARDREADFRTLFQDSPIALWQMDCSALPDHFQRLRDKGVEDFRAFFNDHPEAALQATALMQTMKVNKATTLELYRARTEEELLGGLDRILDPDSAPTLADELAALAGGETRFTGEVVNLTMDEDRRNLILNFSVPPGNETTLGRVFVSLIDVTEQKILESARRQSEADFRSLFEDSPIPLWQEDFSALPGHFQQLRDCGVKDLAAHFRDNRDAVLEAGALMRIIRVNKATLRLYGAGSQDQLIGSLDRILDFEALHTLADELAALAEGQTSFTSQVVNRTLGGRKLWLSLHLAVPPGHEKTLDRVFVSMIDITEEKKVWEEKERMVVELSQALDEVETLSGFLPICANCHKIRDDEGYWHRVEKYIQARSKATFSHGICPDCMGKLYPDLTDDAWQTKGLPDGAEPGEDDG